MKKKEVALTTQEINALLDCASLVGEIAENPLLRRISGSLDSPEHYEIIHSLARGGHSEVFVVKDVRDKRVYAMKKVQKTHILEDPLVNPIMRERSSMIIGRESKWLLGLQKSFQDSTSLYFLTDFISGGDLGSLCCKIERFTEESIRFFSGEILLALSELHSLGMIHRDIKPENILICSDGHIKLADFGSVAFLNGEDHGVVVGTPDYVAPELLEMTRQYITEKVDVWSLGVVVYELFFGETPFYMDTIKKTYQRILKMEYTIGECSEELKDLLQRILCPMEKRLSVKEAMEHKFFDGFEFQNPEMNPVTYIPQFQGDASIDNFEVEEFVHAQGVPPKPLENLQNFLGFGYDPTVRLVHIMEEEDVVKDAIVGITVEKDVSTGITIEEDVSTGIIVEENEAECITVEKEVSRDVIVEETMSKDLIVEEDVTECITVEEDVTAGVVVEEDVTECVIVEEESVVEEEESVVEEEESAVEEESSVMEESGITKEEEPLFSKKEEETSKSIPLEPTHLSITACVEQPIKEYHIPQKTINYLTEVESLLEDGLKALSALSLAAAEKDIDTIMQQSKEREALLIAKKEEVERREEEASFRSKRTVRRLQAELRDSQSRIEREVEIRTSLADKKSILAAENKELREQIRRLKLGSQIRNFPVKLYQEKKWIPTVMYLEEDSIRIQDTRLPLNKIYFQSLRKNELMRMNSKGEALSFKLLLPIEEDLSTGHTESSSDIQGSAADDSVLRSDLEKEMKILEGIDRILRISEDETSKSIIMKQKIGTERKIKEIKQILAQGSPTFSEPNTVKYNNHTFKATTFNTSLQVWCHECNRPLYGTSRQGLICRGCKIICHRDCHTLVEYSCELQQAMDKGTSITLMAKHIEDKERIRDIIGTNQG
ncbi:serine/threonine-protein kinase MRCK [Nematocida sp. LUAm3]|nr:serine/threonine-protein kinase MRCK [Nematocida sp. LUAm3]KAI5174860.1 serine/threonine-protein kinase MRCK [Nematocida sp. LUAm2]KAI5177542.1 serine/threonine-protein kinase MRCK [Nematocida sp. LUAm1]